MYQLYLNLREIIGTDFGFHFTININGNFAHLSEVEHGYNTTFDYCTTLINYWDLYNFVDNC